MSHSTTVTPYDRSSRPSMPPITPLSFHIGAGPSPRNSLTPMQTLSTPRHSLTPQMTSAPSIPDTPSSVRRTNSKLQQLAENSKRETERADKATALVEKYEKNLLVAIRELNKYKAAYETVKCSEEEGKRKVEELEKQVEEMRSQQQMQQQRMIQAGFDQLQLMQMSQQAQMEMGHMKNQQQQCQQQHQCQQSCQCVHTIETRIIDNSSMKNDKQQMIPAATTPPSNTTSLIPSTSQAMITSPAHLHPHNTSEGTIKVLATQLVAAEAKMAEMEKENERMKRKVEEMLLERQQQESEESGSRSKSSSDRLSSSSTTASDSSSTSSPTSSSHTSPIASRLSSSSSSTTSSTRSSTTSSSIPSSSTTESHFAYLRACEDRILSIQHELDDTKQAKRSLVNHTSQALSRMNLELAIARGVIVPKDILKEQGMEEVVNTSSTRRKENEPAVIRMEESRKLKSKNTCVIQ